MNIENLIILTLVFSTIYTIKLEAPVPKCRILALEGGGDKGIYQAGAYKAIIENLPNEEKEYDVYTGISAGSLNSAGLILFEKGKEQEGLDFIMSVWSSIKNSSDIFISGTTEQLVENVLLGTSLYKTTPLKELITKVIGDRKVMKPAVFGATNYNTGYYQTIRINQTDPTEKLIEAVLASSAIEILFTPRKYGNFTFGDGGLTRGFDIPSGVDVCRELGFEDKDIIADVIVLQVFNARISSENVKNFNTLDSIKRAKKIWSNSEDRLGLAEMEILFPDVTIRYVFGPKTSLEDETFPIDFIPKTMEEVFEKGYNQTIHLIKKYPNGNYQNGNVLE